MLTGTNTGVGKTVVAAAIAALTLAARRQVAVLKPAQTGVNGDEPGDLEVIRGLAGNMTTRELARFPDPLAPDTAARRAGRLAPGPSEIAAVAGELARSHDLVLVEGSGGLLVRLDQAGATIADVAWSLGAPVLIVAQAGLGTLSATALTAEALQHRGITCAGVVIGEWPAAPDLAARCNLEDLPVAAGVPLVGAVPAGAAALSQTDFLRTARRALAPSLGGEFDAKEFAAEHAS